MDRYPEHLEPRFEPSGAVEEPFEEWWSKVQAAFPNVPENVARHWLHEHWSHSPYSYLRSANYRFEEVEWTDLRPILTSWSDFMPNNAGAIAKGKELCTDRSFGSLYRTAQYMLDNRRFPEPIIVLDNRDGHHNADYPEEFALPSGYILIEGHSRFNIGLYLHVEGLMHSGKLWLMQRILT
jgi:hypothetical protein